MKYHIGIVGNGFVGSAVQFGFSPTTAGPNDYEIKVYDKDPLKSVDSIEETVNESDFIFLSVPTPSNKDGSMNLDIVEQALKDISEVISLKSTPPHGPLVLLRSTVVPGTTRRLQDKYSNLNLIFNPEFLTERSAKYDFINQSRIVVGGGDETIFQEHCVERVGDLFRWRFGETVPVIETDWETAELIKYMGNCFFATKISFMNEMYQIAEKCNVDWEVALDGFVRDGRVGHSHMNIPGPDGKFGFGGSCFPKDVQAIIHFGESLGLNMNTIKGVWKTNLEVRPERDWEELKGRAVVDETD